jgi:hypothetical protein
MPATVSQILDVKLTTGNGNDLNLLKLACMEKFVNKRQVGFSHLEPLCEGGQRRRRSHCVAAATVAIRSPARPK